MNAVHPTNRGRLGEPNPEARCRWRSTTAGLIGLALATLLGACQDRAVPTTPSALEVQSWQGTADDECSVGDARALLETLPVANEIFLREGPDQPWAQTLLTCQYRLFWEDGHPVLGQPVSFSEEDVFLGGFTSIVPYKNLGMMRAQAEEALAAIEIRVWLAEVTEAGVGELVEQPVLKSAFKQAVTDRFGLVLWRQSGFITQLPPGEYVSVTEVTRPVFFDDEFLWTVSLFID